VTLLHPTFLYQRWMGFMAFQIINIIACFGACFQHFLPNISTALLIFNMLSVGVIMITLYSTANTRTTAESFLKLSTFQVARRCGIHHWTEWSQLVSLAWMLPRTWLKKSLLPAQASPKL
jgi:hypothetical protein